jgi:hypothetical protein
MYVGMYRLLALESFPQAFTYPCSQRSMRKAGAPKAPPRLAGPPVENLSGTLKCAGVFDEDFRFFAESCP